MRIGLIWAEARGGAIGRAGAMPWYLPEDLTHFKQTTLGAPVIMGRRTWESLPKRFRPLPGRENIVVSRDASYPATGATVRSSLEQAIAAIRCVEDPPPSTSSGGGGGSGGGGSRVAAWVIGGGELYRTAMPFADELVVTRIELDVNDADTFAPEIGPEWQLADPGLPQVSKTGLGYRFQRWTRSLPLP